MADFDLKQELATQAAGKEGGNQVASVKLSKEMSIPDIVRALGPELKKALPSVLTPERFTRIALSALNQTPQLQQCTPMSFIGALLSAAQLGLEPNSPLGQAYLIPFKNKGVMECQFQIGYKGLIDLAYRNGGMQTIQAHTVYAGDEFEFEYGLNPKLVHRPASEDRGEPVWFYGLYRMVNGGYGFYVMSKAEMNLYAANYSKAFSSGYSPWKTNYEEMAKKTVIKRALKYAPIKTEFHRALSNDETIKTRVSANMDEITNEMSYVDVA